jgi:hypothetical protein
MELLAPTVSVALQDLEGSFPVDLIGKPGYGLHQASCAQRIGSSAPVKALSRASTSLVIVDMMATVVESALAPPPTRRSTTSIEHLVAPGCPPAIKRRRGRRGSSGDGDGGDFGGFGSGGSGWGGNWGDGWNNFGGGGGGDWHSWSHASKTIYHAVCMLTLSRCLHYALVEGVAADRQAPQHLTPDNLVRA